MRPRNPPIQYVKSTAEFDSTGAFRYHLSRYWDPTVDGTGFVLWVMLNPSTADAERLDPTLRKCQGFSLRWGAAGFEVVNAYAYRATDPRNLERAGFPIGPENDAWIFRRAVAAETVILGWGARIQPARQAALLDLIRMARDGKSPPRALGFAGSGQPRHPLYMPYTASPLLLR